MQYSWSGFLHQGKLRQHLVRQLVPSPRKLCEKNEILCKIDGKIALKLAKFALKLCANFMVVVYVCKKMLTKLNSPWTFFT